MTQHPDHVLNVLVASSATRTGVQGDHEIITLTLHLSPCLFPALTFFAGPIREHVRDRPAKTTGQCA